MRTNIKRLAGRKCSAERAPRKVIKYAIIAFQQNNSLYACSPDLASFPDLPAHPQTLYARLFFYPLKAVRSGRFYAVMMMSPGRGLVRHGHGLEECRRISSFTGCSSPLSDPRSDEVELNRRQKLELTRCFVQFRERLSALYS